MLLLHRNATLTVCHSRTQDLPSVVRQADILVAAVGRPEMVKGDWIKPGAAVVDVGVNAVDDADDPRGFPRPNGALEKRGLSVMSILTAHRALQAR